MGRGSRGLATRLRSALPFRYLSAMFLILDAPWRPALVEDDRLTALFYDITYKREVKERLTSGEPERPTLMEKQGVDAWCAACEGQKQILMLDEDLGLCWNGRQSVGSF